ncbi:NAD(P)/FAD-dependent oxidoreductase [Bacillus solimangrovi]|uniref:FAD/NAD(P)-binding domain-containing protein n=1 Tax=Bacillus solimangrovi TaxID=1305675 RepID=A0A1E5LKA9_9BACI|nr:FAD-dependent oxidoreductase [Bacillus solimangrovi]OEH94529.1 hypothetical protein BFG57_07620 [Bacillus solimangrovi]
MKTIVILGGGYAGINLINNLKKELKNELGSSVKIILIDKNSYHYRKLLLVKTITEDVDKLKIAIPFQDYLSEGIEFIQGEIVSLNRSAREVNVRVEDNQIANVPYDYLAITLGSIVKEYDEIIGGETLRDEASAHKIRNELIDFLDRTKKQSEDSIQNNDLKVAVVGGGISGIETACELGVWLQGQSRVYGIDPDAVEVLLFDSKSRVLHQAPEHISSKLEKKMESLGVTFISNTRVKQYRDGRIICDNGKMYEVGSCIITNGVEVSPVIKQLNLPLSNHNQLIVNECYEITGIPNVYAIGDCAQIIDTTTNECDGMTCKEAIPQSLRLAKIIKNRLNNHSKQIIHKGLPYKLFFISLGPNDGFVWAQKWGMNFTLSGQIGLRLRKFTWDLASLVKER